LPCSEAVFPSTFNDLERVSLLFAASAAQAGIRDESACENGCNTVILENRTQASFDLSFPDMSGASCTPPLYMNIDFCVIVGIFTGI
jgi:hypothetical protein